MNKKTFSKPIYDAPIDERLADLKQIIESAQKFLRLETMRPCTDNAEGLEPGEFALGNWIIRPRFK